MSGGLDANPMVAKREGLEGGSRVPDRTVEGCDPKELILGRYPAPKLEECVSQWMDTW